MLGSECCRMQVTYTQYCAWTHRVYLALVPAGNRLTALMSSWRSSSFQPFPPPPPPPPPLAWSALRAACLAWTSASLSRCSWAFTSCTWTEEHQHVCTLVRTSHGWYMRVSWWSLQTKCLFTCFSTAALLSSFEPEARISFSDCRLETYEYHKTLIHISGLCFLKALQGWDHFSLKLLTSSEIEDVLGVLIYREVSNGFKSITFHPLRTLLTLPCQFQTITELFHLLHHFHTVSFIVSKVIPVLWSEDRYGDITTLTKRLWLTPVKVRVLQWEWTLQVVLSFCLSFLMAFFWISFSFLACWAACLASSSSFSFCSRAASSSACRACWRGCKLTGECCQRDDSISGANCKGWLWGIRVCVSSLETSIFFKAWSGTSQLDSERWCNIPISRLPLQQLVTFQNTLTEGDADKLNLS